MMTKIDTSFLQSADLSLLAWILLGVVAFFFLVQVFYYTIIYRRPSAYQKKRENNPTNTDSFSAISVVIASKNESENLAKNLPSILEQDYPNFEVIIVNMGSTDETDVVLKALNQNYTNLYHTYIPADAEEINEKKLALTIGIKAARNEILLFTEAYCKPVSNKWLSEFAAEFANGKDVVLGNCQLQISKKTSMRKFIQYDNMIHCLKFLSLAIMGKPFMGMGRNMAYKKEIFFEEKGFSSLLKIDGGEDDLFINRIAKKKKTGVVLSPDSMTQTTVVDKFKTWRALKSKYLYTKQFYKGASNAIFWLETFSKYSFLLSTGIAIVVGILLKNYLLLSVAAVLLIIRFVIQLLVLNRSTKLFAIAPFHIDLFFYDIFQPINNMKFRKFANRKSKNKR